MPDTAQEIVPDYKVLMTVVRNVGMLASYHDGMQLQQMRSTLILSQSKTSPSKQSLSVRFQVSQINSACTHTKG